MKNLILIVFGMLLFSNTNIAQTNFQIYGSAQSVSPDPDCSELSQCFRLTNSIGQQASVFHPELFDLREYFDGTFCLYLGNPNVNATCWDDLEDNGADGFAFLLKAPGTAAYGNSGGGVGYEGISPSVGIEFDTYPNGVIKSDIAEDHTGLFYNGDLTTAIEGPLPLLVGGVNAEDGQYHYARLVWDPNTFTLSMYFDGVLRFSHVEDLSTNVFGGLNEVEWGFTASTGGCYNVQEICFPTIALDLEPKFEFCGFSDETFHYFRDNLTYYSWEGPDGKIVEWDQFDPNQPDTTITVYKSGIYSLEVKHNNTTYKDDFEVIFYSGFDLGNDTIFCDENIDLILDPRFQIYDSYEWSTGETGSSISVSEEGVYTCDVSIQMTNPSQLCEFSDEIELIEECSPIILLPNVFSPFSSDDRNDLFLPLTFDFVGEHQFIVYNRWGKEVYSTNNLLLGWDGKSINNQQLTSGTYYYELKYKDEQGLEYIPLTGHVTVF